MIDADGATLYEHLVRLRNSDGIVDPRLVPIPLPACADWIHRQFWRLSNRRQRSEVNGAPKPLTYAEIETLERLNRIPFTRFDLQAIEEMDAAHMKAASKTTRG